MKKRSKKQKAMEDAKWAHVFQEGFDMGCAVTKREMEGMIKNAEKTVDKMDRRCGEKGTW